METTETATIKLLNLQPVDRVSLKQKMDLLPASLEEMGFPTKIRRRSVILSGSKADSISGTPMGASSPATQRIRKITGNFGDVPNPWGAKLRMPQAGWWGLPGSGEANLREVQSRRPLKETVAPG